MTSGRILVIWNTRSWSATKVVRGIFSISISFSDSEGKDFWVLGVYGPPRPQGREAFWEELGDLYGYCGSRWCVVGDFNVVRSLE